MMKFQALINSHMEELATLISLENGKTLQDAKGDVFRGLEVVESCCDLGTKLMGESLMGIGKGIDCTSFKVPLGVCAGIGKKM